MFSSIQTATRIKQLAKDQNLTIKQILKDSGLSANTMSNMKNSMPKADNLAKIADCLNCSVDYLLGRTESKIISISTSGNDGDNSGNDSSNAVNSNNTTNNYYVNDTLSESICPNYPPELSDIFILFNILSKVNSNQLKDIINYAIYITRKDK